MPERRPVLIYSGQPLVFDSHCGEEEIAECGLTCSFDEPCQVYLEPASIAAAGSKLLVAGNFHTESATLSSLLLVSDDGGRTWEETWPRASGVALDLAQFVDFATAYVAGHTAGALPRDPFLLKTADGGAHWIRLPLFEEGSVGLIESMRFDSATRGAVVVDRGRPGAGRFVTLETEVGATAWTMREASATRTKLPANGEPASWRISADAPSRAFRIQHQDGRAWTIAAAFAVQAGTCTPPKPVLREPPAREPDPPAPPRN